MVQQRVLETARGRFLFRVTPAARQYLLKEGTDLKYGARHLKRAIERHIVYPLASLLATEQVVIGDVLSIDWDAAQSRLIFLKEREGALLTPVMAASPQMRPVAAANGRGRSVAVHASSSETQAASRFPATAPASSEGPSGSCERH
jgi:hypothetical protein